ncbi:hypothetical protein OG250_35700 [Streptomyces sp. NBC_00487]|uniref:hypothetical protein n=1 Tax=unclassified Streptomyces TaxID=2593676 RepID=UPI002DD95CD4|nr:MULTISPECIES: hypothetical protein [unclassified Streptomyces]WRY99693.1 hypothetical protein OG889_36335 [Streptomyces sp. NBC_00481]
MQQSAVPELAHAHTRPIHWLATATALAAVVALSSALQPDAARAAQPDPKADRAPAVVTAPDPTEVDLPLDCGPVGVVVKNKGSGDLDGDGRPETVAVAHCDASMGTPPDGVYVLTRSTDAAQPRVVATLVNPKDRKTVTDFAVRDAAVTATLHGYSSADVPNCCPDVKDLVKWQWKNGAFTRSTPAGAQSV